MNCQSCNAEVSPNNKFCPECGTTVSNSINCTHCGEQNPPGSTFCPKCGNSVSSSSANKRRDNDGAEFAYLLSEEKILTITEGTVKLPYGCFAVTLVDGEVQNIQDQTAILSEGTSVIGQFFRSVSDFARGLMGQKEHQVKTYIVTNCQNLPIISYVQTVVVPGNGGGNLKFDFWLNRAKNLTSNDKEALGLFFERIMGNKLSLRMSEFREVVIDKIREIVAKHSGPALDTDEGREEVMRLLNKSIGVSGRCSFVRGKNLVRRFIEIEKIQEPIACPGCKHLLTEKVRFCEVCGEGLEKLNWAGSFRILQASSGEAVVVKLSLLVDASEGNIQRSDSEITRVVLEALLPVIRKLSATSLSLSSTLTNLGLAAAQSLGQVFKGEVSEVVVTDIRTANEEWFFKTDALIAEELRNIESDKRGLSVDEAAIDYRETAFAITMRAALQQDDQEYQQRRVALDTRSKMIELEIKEHETELRTALKREGLDHEAESLRFDREMEKVRRDRDFNREEVRENRIDEVEQSTHELRLEKDVASHDIDLADLTGDAKSRARRRDVSDSTFEQEELLRLKAKEKEQIGHIDQDLLDRENNRQIENQDKENNRQIEKLKAMADMEAAMARQDQEFELSKADKLKDLDASQILAMQAAQLAKAAGAAGAVDVVKSIAQAQSDATGAAIKDEMYSKILQTKDEATRLAMEAQNTAMDSLLKSNETMARAAGATSSAASEGYKEAARIAQSTNEKSMESMSKVATATASRKEGKSENDISGVACCNANCDHVFDGKAKKFCPKCGQNQINN